MDKILIFSGTSDGGKTAEFLAQNGYNVTVSVATEYGEKCAPSGDNITIHCGRMTAEEIYAFISGNFSTVIDATHPYASAASENIKKAAGKAGATYYRLLRDTFSAKDVVEVESVKEAAEFLQSHDGTALIATGSKELTEYTAVKDYKDRLVARVLSTADSVNKCRELGFEGKNLIAMQGPFTEELNYAMLRSVGARWLVTKESGTAGGFEEKLLAAKRAGAKVILVKRPVQDKNGYTYKDLIFKLTGKLPDKEITLVGIGMGSSGSMTKDAESALKNAELIIGADRMLNAVSAFGKRTYSAYKAEEIVQKSESSEFSKIAVALSGDVGFYSGAKKLCTLLKSVENVKVRLVPGVSSVVYLASRLKKSWDDAVILSLHGKSGNMVSKVKHNKKVFAIAGRGSELAEVFDQLSKNGLGGLTAYVGSELSYENEKIVKGTISELAGAELCDLSTVLIENDNFVPKTMSGGIPDEEFIRGKVPMTKEEVRTLSLSKLHLTEDAVLYDVGAGTGSVSIEAAILAENGTVYAIERNDEACELIEKNCRKFGVTNLEIVKGLAPDALKALPRPTHVFIGGSAGNMRDIVYSVLEKNPKVRVVINTIAMESTAEALEIVNTMPVKDVDIAQITVAKSRKVSAYNMMTGANPVYIISFTGDRA